MVKVAIVSSLCYITKDWDADITLEQLCKKLEPLTGVSPSDMKLTLEFEDGKPSRTFESPFPNPELYPFELVDHGIRIVVEDLNENSVASQLQATDEADSSFQLSEEAYAERKDSVLKWKMQNNWGRFDPEMKRRQENDCKFQEEKASHLELGQRCRVSSDGQPERRGLLRYLGRVPDISDQEIWCGVEFDEAVGKNDGTFRDEVYFGPVEPKHGGFVKPSCVETGAHFSPLREDDESDDEI